MNFLNIILIVAAFLICMFQICFHQLNFLGEAVFLINVLIDFTLSIQKLGLQILKFLLKKSLSVRGLIILVRGLFRKMLIFPQGWKLFNPLVYKLAFFLFRASLIWREVLIDQFSIIFIIRLLLLLMNETSWMQTSAAILSWILR